MIESYVRSKKLISLSAEICRLVTAGSERIKNKNLLLSLCLEGVNEANRLKDYYSFFHFMDDLLFTCCVYFPARIPKYAQLFFQAIDQHLEETMLKYPDDQLPKLIVYDFGYIFQVYREFYQIDDVKLEQFLQRFYERAVAYDVEDDYYQCLLRLSLLNRDQKLAVKAADGFQKNKLHGCYICKNICMFGYYFLIDEPESAEALLQKIIAKDYDKINQEFFPNCENSGAEELYSCLLAYSLEVGKPEYFKLFFPNYLNIVNQNIPVDQYNYGAMNCYYRAIIGDFSKLSEDREQLKTNSERFKNKSATTFSLICDFLCWYLYFSLYAEIFSDTITLDFEIPSLSPLDEKGTYSAAELSKVFEKLADKYGEKLEQSRKQFSYSTFKQSFEAIKQYPYEIVYPSEE